MVRIYLGDEAARDWYHPFIEAQLVGEEAQIRDRLGLPPLLPGDVDGLAYFMFFDTVLAGEPDPFRAWLNQWPELYLAGEGPAPTTGSTSTN
jgi:hypothetical protein